MSEIKKFYDVYSHNYDRDHLAPQSAMSYVENHRRELILSMLKNCHGLVLDVACGTGYYLELLKDSNRSVLGGDIAKGMVEACKRKKLGDGLYIGNYENIPFKDKTFDVVLCINSFQYTRNPQELLKEMERVLKDSGEIVLTYFNLANWRIVNLLRKFLFFASKGTAPALEHRYTKMSFAKHAQKAGLRIIEKAGINFLPYAVSAGRKNKLILKTFAFLEKKYRGTILMYLANELIVKMVKERQCSASRG